LKQVAAATTREIAFDASRLPGFAEAHLSLPDAEWRLSIYVKLTQLVVAARTISSMSSVSLPYGKRDASQFAGGGEECIPDV
jgi:hypothetical protein